MKNDPEARPVDNESESAPAEVGEEGRMFRTGERTDFERMLADILARAKAAAVNTAGQIEAEASARGGSVVLGDRFSYGTTHHTPA